MEPSSFLDAPPEALKKALSQSYSKAEYLKKTERVQTCPLHFLLALDQPLNNVINYAKNHSDKLLKQDKEFYYLTPLMIAILKINVSIVQAFLSLAEQQGLLEKLLDIGNKSEWKAIHFAALASPPLLAILQDKGAYMRAKTLYNFSVKSIQKATHHQAFTPSLNHSFLSIGSVVKKSFSALSNQELEQFTGLQTYTDALIYTGEDKNKLWQIDPPESTSVVDSTVWNRWKNNPPRLLVTECKQIKNRELNCILELRALEDIQAGAMIGTYGGKYLSESLLYRSFVDLYKASSQECYRSFHVDAQDMGNVIRFANHGFPNACLASCFIKGIDYTVLIALDKIKADAPILLSYPKNFLLTFDKDCLLGREDLEKFFRKGLDSLIQEFWEGVESNHENKVRLLLQRLIFPSTSPAALLYLHFKDIICIAEWYPYIMHDRHIVNGKRNIIGENFCSQPNILYGYMRSVVRRIQEISTMMEVHPEWRKPLASWVLESLGTLDLMKIFKGLEMIKTYLSSRSIKDFDFEVISKTLSTYNWQNDKDAPLSLKKRKEDFYKDMVLCSQSSLAYEPRQIPSWLLLQHAQASIEKFNFPLEDERYQWKIYALKRIQDELKSIMK
jgi:hypothetical protein